MRQEQRSEGDVRAGGVAETALRREARESAHRWLARFAPLLDDPATLTADACRARLDLVDELRAEGATVLQTLQARADAEDASLLTTLQAALPQLDGLEADLKRRLGLLAPGDPEGMVDLDALRAQLAEAAARRELGVSRTAGAVGAPARLEIPLSPSNGASAGFMGLFSLGWLSFTTFHAFLMIGGMMHAFGWGALALLGFYAIFWGVGLSMAAGALAAASSESLEVEGKTLTLRRRLGFWTRERTHRLAPNSRAYLATPNLSPRPGIVPGHEIAVLDADGREIRFGRGCSPHRQQQVITQLNEHWGGPAGRRGQVY